MRASGGGEESFMYGGNSTGASRIPERSVLEFVSRDCGGLQQGFFRVFSGFFFWGNAPFAFTVHGHDRHDLQTIDAIQQPPKALRYCIQTPQCCVSKQNLKKFSERTRRNESEKKGPRSLQHVVGFALVSYSGILNRCLM